MIKKPLKVWIPKSQMQVISPAISVKLGLTHKFRGGVIPWKFRNGIKDSNVCQSKKISPLNLTEKEERLSVVV